MGAEELAAVYRVLGEKELRVHVDIEERIEGLHMVVGWGVCDVMGLAGRGFNR